QWLALEPRSARAFRARGLAYEALQKYDKALDDLNESVSIDPSSPAALDRDSVLQKSREVSSATGDLLEPKLEQRHDDYNALVCDALKLRLAFDFERGLAVAGEAIALRPDLPAAYYCRARLKESAHRVDEVVPDYEQALRVMKGKAFDLPE